MDTDNDGLMDDLEAVYYTDVSVSDTDLDGYLDGEEVRHGYSPLLGKGKRMHESDHDQDGLNDWLERWFKSDIGKTDTDDNGETDFDAVMKGKAPVGEKTFAKKIVVDRTKQQLYYYVDTVKIVSMPVSTGNPHTPTPAGEFTIQKKIPDKRYTGPGYDLKGVKWNMQFKPSYYIHAAYWHNDFGKRTHSHGCVNLTEKDSELLYKYIETGTAVSVIGTTPARFAVGT